MDDPSDAGYEAYRVALHEVGHALGMSGFSVRDLLGHGISSFEKIQEALSLVGINVEGTVEQRYETSHPTIPDSVMNYDSREEPLIRHPQVTDEKFNEPDCSPHPFDVLALNALYQNVPKVSVTAPVSGTSGDRITLTASLSGGVAPFIYRWSYPEGPLTFSPSADSSTVTVTLPEPPTGASRVTIELVVTDQNGTEARRETSIGSHGP